MQHGARLDHQDAQGNTVFHWCARQGYVAVVTLDDGFAASVNCVWLPHLRWGTLPMTIITQAEALDPGVAKGSLELLACTLMGWACVTGTCVDVGVMRIRNLKGKLPVEVHDDPETAAELVRTFSKFSLVATAEPSPSPKSKKSAFRRKFKDAKRCVSCDSWVRR